MRKRFDEKSARFYYLNNSGSRGVEIDHNGRRETLLFQSEIGGTIIERSIVYHQMLGNFSFPFIRVKGKVVAVYPSNNDESVFQTFETKYSGEVI